MTLFNREQSQHAVATSNILTRSTDPLHTYLYNYSLAYHPLDGEIVHGMLPGGLPLCPRLLGALC